MKLFLILAGLFVSLSQAAQLTVKWDDQSDNELGFAVERAPAPPSTEFVEIGRTAPDVVTYIDNTLASSTQYQYRVRAYGAKNYSEYSNIGLGTTNTVITPDDVALGPILPPGNIAVAPPPDPRPLHYVAPSIRFPSTMASIPARCDPYNNGTPNNDYGDYWSDSIQYLYYPDGTKSSKAGIAAGRTFAYYRGVFATAPLPDAYRSSDPDPATTVGAYVTKNGGRPLENAIAQARTSATTANDTVVLYRSGVIAIASTQTGMNAHGKVNIWPWYKLPPEKEPMDIAVSSNNELMLVAVYDNVLQKGQLAVFMCESKVLPFHTFHFAGLHGQPGFSDFILLGYVDLPIGKSLAEFPATLKLSVASGGAWESPTTTNNLSLDNSPTG